MSKKRKLKSAAAKKHDILARKELKKLNRLIAAGESFRPSKLTMKQFRKETEKFRKVNFYTKGTHLKTIYRDFISASLTRTPLEIASARNNFIANMKETQKMINRGELLDYVHSALFDVGTELGYWRKSERGTVFFVTGNIPTPQDFNEVTDRYLQLKRKLSEKLGESYNEAFGS